MMNNMNAEFEAAKEAASQGRVVDYRQERDGSRYGIYSLLKDNKVIIIFMTLPKQIVPPFEAIDIPLAIYLMKGE